MILVYLKINLIDEVLYLDFKMFNVIFLNLL